MTQYLDPADKIIRRFGGAKALGKKLEVSRSQIHRWRTPKGKGGCDGVIPRKHHEQLISLANESQVKLESSDLIPWLPLQHETLSEGDTSQSSEAA